MSKAAANMLTKVLACEWADRNIRVNAIAPGYIRTELVEGVIEEGYVASWGHREAYSAGAHR